VGGWVEEEEVGQSGWVEEEASRRWGEEEEEADRRWWVGGGGGGGRRVEERREEKKWRRRRSGLSDGLRFVLSPMLCRLRRMLFLTDSNIHSSTRFSPVVGGFALMALFWSRPLVLLS
jgi:hypothetical protein